MYNILFYIFFVLIIAGMLITAFSKNMLNSTFSVIVILISLGGLLTLLNSVLYSLLLIIVIAFILILLSIFYPRVSLLALGEHAEIVSYRYYLIILVSLLAAIVTSIVSSTRWQWLAINFELNSFALIFTKYLPAALILAIISSVILSTFSYFRRMDETV